VRRASTRRDQGEWRRCAATAELEAELVREQRAKREAQQGVRVVLVGHEHFELVCHRRNPRCALRCEHRRLDRHVLRPLRGTLTQALVCSVAVAGQFDDADLEPRWCGARPLAQRRGRVADAVQREEPNARRRLPHRPFSSLLSRSLAREKRRGVAERPQHGQLRSHECVVVERGARGGRAPADREQSGAEHEKDELQPTASRT
jgi:hypothetical protein